MLTEKVDIVNTKNKTCFLLGCSSFFCLSFLRRGRPMCLPAEGMVCPLFVETPHVVSLFFFFCCELARLFTPSLIEGCCMEGLPACALWWTKLASLPLPIHPVYPELVEGVGRPFVPPNYCICESGSLFCSSFFSLDNLSMQIYNKKTLPDFSGRALSYCLILTSSKLTFSWTLVMTKSEL